MWTQNDKFGGGDGGGGFVQNANNSFSGTQDKSGNRRKTSNIVPVAIKQLLECDGDTFRIDDFEANTVTVLGIVRKVETLTTKVTYQIDDLTGTIEAVMYQGVENDGGSSDPDVLMENTYGRFVGALRGAADKSKYLVLFASKKVEDMNELTAHLLEMISLPIKLKKIKEMENLKMSGGMMNTGNNSMNQGGAFGRDLGSQGGSYGGNQSGNAGGGQTINGFTSKQTLVFKAVQSYTTEPGGHIKDIAAALAGRMSLDEVRSTLNFLTEEGHCFLTVDDDHFQATDWTQI